MLQVICVDVKEFEDKTGKKVPFQEIGVIDTEKHYLGKLKSYDMTETFAPGDEAVIYGYLKYDGSVGVTVKKA